MSAPTWETVVAELRLSAAGHGHDFFTRDEARRIFWRAAARLKSLRRATFWIRMYREELYGRSLFERRMREKLHPLIHAAKDDMARLRVRYGLGWYFGDSVLDCPRWGGYAASATIEDVLQRRKEFWRKRGNARWESYWGIRHDAVAYVRERWPLTPEALRRAERWRAIEDAHEAQEKIKQEAWRERELIEGRIAERTRRREIEAEAKSMVADLLPGSRVRRRMAKAKAFDARWSIYWRTPMLTQKPKMRLADLEALSKKNAEMRSACLRSLSTLPTTATASDIQQVVTREYPAMMDEIIVAGARAIMATVRAERPAASRGAPIDLEQAKARRRQRDERFTEAAREIVHRVEVGSAVVEMLDKLTINGKLLGDCTRGELIREADAEGDRAEAMAAHAGWLRKLGESVGPNETVRTANRATIIAVLRERFGE